MDRRSFLGTLTGLTGNYVADRFLLPGGGGGTTERGGLPERGTGPEIDSSEYAEAHLDALEGTSFTVSIRSRYRTIDGSGRQLDDATKQVVNTYASDGRYERRHLVSGAFPVSSVLSVGGMGNESYDTYYDGDTAYVWEEGSDEGVTMRSRNFEWDELDRQFATGYNDLRGLLRGAGVIDPADGTSPEWVGYSKPLRSESVGFRPVRVVGAVHPEEYFESYRIRFRRDETSDEPRGGASEVLTAVVEFSDLGCTDVGPPDWVTEYDTADGSKAVDSTGP